MSAAHPHRNPRRRPPADAAVSPSPAAAMPLRLSGAADGPLREGRHPSAASVPTRRPLRLLVIGTSASVAGLTTWAQQLPSPVKLVQVLAGPDPQALAAAEKADLAVPAADGGLDVACLERCLDAHAVDLAVLSLPIAMADTTDHLVAVLERRGLAWRWVPTLSDQLAGRVRQWPGGAWRSRLVQSSAVTAPAVWSEAASLLDRRPVPLDATAVRTVLEDRVVLVTGAGGSIGSELVRQIAAFAPRKIILVERAENALFQIDRLIARLAPDLPREAVLHDVTDAAGTDELLARVQPHVIFHAAAHKHVPMMEDHPAAAVENNFYGTRSIADAADRCGVDRFVMISSDKAVNPSSVMGATKRMAELYIQALNERSRTRFCMVRFGNVLGSACSVLPIWQQQLAHGGPLTVTHPQMQRYFMTIPEAAGLVIQSAALTGRASAGGGEVFLLDMGDPVRIVDLAERFLRSQGLEPNVDVAISFTGIRPGEKLFEELAYDGEDMLPTPHESVHVWKSSPPTADRMREVTKRFDALRDGRENNAGAAGRPWQGVCRAAILDAIHWAVPEMVDAAGATAMPAPTTERAAAG